MGSDGSEARKAGWGPDRASLIVNTRSRTGERVYYEALDRLRALGLPLRSTCALRDPSRLAETVHRAVNEEGSDLVILGGGDGSVSSVVDHLVGSEAVLGLLPLGTANDFARTLQIPADVGGACDTIASGRLVDVDLGMAAENYYVNLASAGLSVEVTRALTPWLKKSAGALAYPIAAVRAFMRHKPFSARLAFPRGDHPTVEFDRLLQVGVGNGRFYGGGMVIAPDSSMDDQALDVYAIELGRHRDLPGILRYLKSGRFIESERVSHYLTSEVTLETEPELPINIDGELAATTPEHFSLARNALRVLVPQGSLAARYDNQRLADG